MPRARRRRRSAARRGWSRTLVLILILTVATVAIVGSVVEVHAQSGDFRTSTDTGYAQLATLVAKASDQTGAQLAQLMQRLWRRHRTKRPGRPAWCRPNPAAR